MGFYEAFPQKKGRNDSDALILVFNKTVKNRFIWLLFQQPAA